MKILRERNNITFPSREEQIASLLVALGHGLFDIESLKTTCASEEEINIVRAVWYDLLKEYRNLSCLVEL